MDQTEWLGSREHLAREIRRAHEHTEGWAVRPEAEAPLPVGAPDESRGGLESEHTATASRALIRASLTAYVKRLRVDYVPPERMLVLVKSTVTDTLPDWTGTAASQSLVEDAVRWSIETYYETG